MTSIGLAQSPIPAFMSSQNSKREGRQLEFDNSNYIFKSPASSSDTAMNNDESVLQKESFMNTVYHQSQHCQSIPGFDDLVTLESTKPFAESSWAKSWNISRIPIPVFADVTYKG
jgi:hypothetical protein